MEIMVRHFSSSLLNLTWAPKTLMDWDYKVPSFYWSILNLTCLGDTRSQPTITVCSIQFTTQSTRPNWIKCPLVNSVKKSPFTFWSIKTSTTKSSWASHHSITRLGYSQMPVGVARLNWEFSPICIEFRFMQVNRKQNLKTEVSWGTSLAFSRNYLNLYNEF